MAIGSNDQHARGYPTLWSTHPPANDSVAVGGNTALVPLLLVPIILALVISTLEQPCLAIEPHAIDAHAQGGQNGIRSAVVRLPL